MDDSNFAAAFARAEAEWLIEPICGARQHRRSSSLLHPGDQTLAKVAPAAQPAPPPHLGADGSHCDSVAPACQSAASIPERAL
jgi:hypothetical protein